MHKWRFVSTRRRPLNSYGADVESTWKCENCGKTQRLDEDDRIKPFAAETDECDRETVRKVMES
jgi:hypothetical protein